MSAPRRQQEGIRSASFDTERDIVEMKRTFKAREMHLDALHSRKRSTSSALSAATNQHQAYLKGLQPAALQSQAWSTHATHIAFTPAALHPPASATPTAHATFTLAV